MTRQPRLDVPPARCLYASQPTQRPHCTLTATVAYGATAHCPDCDARRSTLGKATSPRQLRPQRPIDVLTWFAQPDEQLHHARSELAAAVTRARAQEQPWSAIAAQLNITKQAAQQRFTQDQPRPG